MTLTEPESTVADVPTRAFPLVPVLAGALALSLVAAGILTVTAGGELSRRAVSACQATLHTMANTTPGVEVSAMTTKSLTEYAATPGAVRIEEDGSGGGTIDETSASDVAELAAFYEERATREAREGIQSFVVSGTVTGDGQTDDASCIVSFRDGQVTGLPGIWIDIF